jgi:hypothetical protein
LQIDKETRIVDDRKEAVMNVVSYDSSRLPPAVQPYADGFNVPAPNREVYGAEVVHLAKQLRRIALRKFTNDYPGLQWSKFSDYHEIMGHEIERFGNHVLQKKVNVRNDAAWYELCAHCPRVAYLYTTYGAELLTTRAQVKALRFRVWKYAMADARTLGEIEEYVIGQVRFGIPTQSNHPPRE